VNFVKLDIKLLELLKYVNFCETKKVFICTVSVVFKLSFVEIVFNEFERITEERLLGSYIDMQW